MTPVALDQQIAEAVQEWRRAAIAFDVCEVQDVGDFTAQNGRLRDRLRAAVEARRQAIMELSLRPTGGKAYDIAVERDGRWLMLHVPEIDCVNQAKPPGAEFMAPDLIAAWSDVQEDSHGMRVHTRLREAPGQTAGQPIQTR